MKKLLFLLLLASLFLSSCSPSSQSKTTSTEEPMLKQETAPSMTAYVMNERIGNGINVGHGGANEVSADEYIRIKEIGFTSVRMLVKWSNGVTNTTDNIISQEYFESVDHAVKLAQDQGLVVVLATDGVPLIQFPGTQSTDSVEMIEEKYLGQMEQVAIHYKNYSNDTLVIELLNEPINVLGPERLNQLYRDAIRAIRKTNPDRTLIIGPESLYSVECLDSLRVPDESNIIIAIHNYEPGDFTNQGTSLFPDVGVTWGGYNDMHDQIETFYKIEAWSNENNLPITINEFGSDGAGDIDSRVAYALAQRSMAEMMGFSWMYFGFKTSDPSFSDFGIFDPSSDTWMQPIVEALLPAEGETEAIGPGVGMPSRNQGGTGGHTNEVEQPITNDAAVDTVMDEDGSTTNGSGNLIDGPAIITKLINEGTITQEQGALITNAFSQGGGSGNDNQDGLDLSPLYDLVKAGSLTQEQADKVADAITLGIK